MQNDIPLIVTRWWYSQRLNFFTALLLPFSWLFRVCICIRRLLYRHHFFISKKFNVPVIVVGNITVGGTGKTPFVIWLVKHLQAQGYQPGIVSRGVGARKRSQAHSVTETDSAHEIGDEAVLLFQHAKCPVVISADRVAAVEQLLNQHHCNIVISDDGLQHYRLARDIEFVLIDAQRQFGNRQLLPAGPLREPIARLKEVDLVIGNGNMMTLIPNKLISLRNSNSTQTLEQFENKKVHAVAGIGNPDRFFQTLQKAGFEIISHPFPDHHVFTAQDFDFNDTLPILMTEKDAVKCLTFADDRYWYLSIAAKIDKRVEEEINTIITKRIKGVGHVEEDFALHTCRKHCTIEQPHGAGNIKE